MIKRILVALDPDSDTPVATRYAADVATRYEAEVSGLAVVDLENIEADTRGGGIGSMYYAEKLRENLTEETRAAAERLIATFDRALEGSGIVHRNRVEEGVPVRRIVEDLKYYDLLVIGKDPHFFYGNPTQETDILAHVLDQADSFPGLLAQTAKGSIDSIVGNLLGGIVERPAMMETLISYFDHHLDIPATADALFLHPNTLRYRLRQIESSLGASLRDPAMVSALYLALEARKSGLA